MAANDPPIEAPLRRPLRVFAFDPMYGEGRLNAITIDVQNEVGLLPGPVGSRVAVVDYDASRGVYYPPVDLDDPPVLTQGGLAPSEADPRFHQQMVYAVTLKVLENFDRALGRRISFRNHKLRIFPHAFNEANAFFDPKLNAVLFGYFTASRDNPGENLPGQTVFTCLSQDIVAHEVTHAMVHRLRKYFLDSTNEDVLAFHEGFADIVAIFQHFTFPDVLRDAIARTRGQLHSPSTLVELAGQFGHATGKSGALRSALDDPDPRRYATATEPHERGSILVAAVFDAFFAIYQRRINDLLVLASGGTGVLPVGELHPALVGRLAEEASEAAQAVLTMCIRAFEYLPPVDVTFGDYLRALVTADYDLVADANLDGRRDLIQAFRRRGIFPDVISLSEDALRLPPAAGGKELRFPSTVVTSTLVGGARAFHPRRPAESTSTEGKTVAHHDLKAWAVDNASLLGLSAERDIEVEGFHSTYRVKASGELVIEVVAQFAQMVNTSKDERFGGLPFRGGATVVAAAGGQVRFVIAKPLSDERQERQLAFVARRDREDPTAVYGGEAEYKARAKRTLRSLHRGLV